MTEQHREATQSGHKAALQLSGKIEGVEGQMREVSEQLKALDHARGQPDK